MNNYTNRHNLPPEIISVLTRDRYNPDGNEIGDYSATTLMAPIQQTVLKRRYPDKLVIRDVIDFYWAFLGSIAHAVLEEQAEDNALVEKRFYTEVLGKKISGSVDHYKDGTISDYKTTKSYKIVKGDYSEWETQLNIYAYLAKMSGYPVTGLRIFAFILDWKESETYKASYPKCPIVEIPLLLWAKTITSQYIMCRVTTLEAATQLPDEDLPQCTKKEMWSDLKDWALYKDDQKRAVKVFKTEEERCNFRPLKEGESLVARYTPRTRCLYHCPVSNLCKQNARLLKEEGVSDEPTIF